MNALRRLAAANPVPDNSLTQLAELLPGPPPVGPLPQRSPMVSRRGLVLGAALALGVAVAAPALALHTQLAETVQQFFASSAPSQAKARIAAVVAGASHGMGTLDQLRLVLSADGPEGQLQLYHLHFTNGDTGTTVVNTSNDASHVVVGASEGRPRPLMARQAIDVRGGSVAFPGRSPVYFDGVIAPQVASVDVVYPDGHSQPIATGDGYMLGWVLPRADGNYGDGEVLAKNSEGDEIGRLDFCQTNQTGSDIEIRSHANGMPADADAACVIPPTPDHG